MNKTYKLQDGGSITATCADDFLTQLREGSKFDNECSDAEYMQHFAMRIKEYNGSIIDCSSAERFLTDLQNIGYIILV